MDERGITGAIASVIAAILAALRLKARQKSNGKTYVVELCSSDRERLDSLLVSQNETRNAVRQFMAQQQEANHRAGEDHRELREMIRDIGNR